MKSLIFVLVVAACGPSLSTVWPVTPTVARTGSFDLMTTHADGSQDHGTAWIVDHHHLITAESRCDSKGTHAIAVGRPVTLVAFSDKLCLLESALDLGNPLIIADSTPDGWRKIMVITDYGALPGAAMTATWQARDVWGSGPKPTRSGVIGLVLAPGKYAGLRDLKPFLDLHHVDWHDEPDMLPPPFDYAGNLGVGSHELPGE